MTAEECTGGDDKQHVHHGRLHWIKLQADHRLREPHQLLFEEIEACGRRRATLAARSPRQEVAERASVRVVPVQCGDQHTTRRLTQPHDRYLVFCVEARET